MRLVLFLLGPILCTVIDPEGTMRTMEIIRYWGYPAEAIEVKTDDGYILEMHRIPHGINGTVQPCRPVVFLQTALVAETSLWLKLPPNQSLPTILADAGYDVWMGNMRGTTYGRNHLRYSTKDDAFWHFTWDEMSRHDLTAMIDKTLEATGAKSLYYVGHSQGKITGAPKIRKFFALCPISSMTNIRGLFSVLAHQLNPVMKVERSVQPIFKVLGDRVLVPHSPMLAPFLQHQCRQRASLCGSVLSAIAGRETEQFNETRIPVFINQLPAGTSAMNIQHWSQMILGDGSVRRFDYGPKKNMILYGQVQPPAYDYSKIVTDTYLFWGEDDSLATPEDVKSGVLTWMNPEFVKESVFLPAYTHLDVVLGWNAYKDIYRPIEKIIHDDFDWNCERNE